MKNLYSLKEMVKNIKRLATDWEKTFVDMFKELYLEYLKNSCNSVLRQPNEKLGRNCGW